MSAVDCSLLGLRQSCFRCNTETRLSVDIFVKNRKTYLPIHEYSLFSALSMASSHHTEVTVQPTYPPPVQYPGTYVVVDQSQQHGASSAKKYNSNYSRVSSILFGFLQIFLCIVTIGGAIMVEMKEANGHELGTGFWCGIIVSVSDNSLFRITKIANRYCSI